MTLALSIRQPWAWAIVAGIKDVENRKWRTKVRGRILIHAAQSIDGSRRDATAWLHGWQSQFRVAIPPVDDLLLGGIIGEAEIVDCVDHSASPWFFGPFGFVLRNARPLPFRPLKGRLGFFEVED